MKATVDLGEFAVVREKAPNSNDHTGTALTTEEGYVSELWCKPAVYSDAWVYKPVTQLSVYFTVFDFARGLYPSAPYMFAPVEAFDAEAVTFNAHPSFMAIGALPDTISSDGLFFSDEYDVPTEDPMSSTVAYILRYGVGLRFGINTETLYSVYTPNGAAPPGLRIVYDDSADDVHYVSDTWEDSYGGGSIVRTAGDGFTLSFVVSANGLCYALSFMKVSRVYAQWRDASGASVNTVEMEIPENLDNVALTFPEGMFGSAKGVVITPYVVTENGSVWQGSPVTVSFSDTTPTAVPVSPVGEVLDSAAAITFRWNHIVTSGLAQTKAELDYSTDGTTWQSLAVINGAQTSYTAPANTFSIGVNFWRVRTYNADGVASEWSQAVQFICVGAPETPVVLIGSASPRPSITWQVEGQLAYQVELEGVYTSGVCYGTGKQWTAPMYLADGSYTVRVRVQNEYGLWSGWGMAVFGVQNTAGAAITLNVESGASAELWWQTSGAYDFYLVYRDGALIAKTTNRMYTDLTSIGAVSYQVRGCFAEDSNYGLSGAVQTDVNVDFITVIDLERSRTLVLPRSASAHRKTSRSFGRNVKSVQLAGRRFPTLERSEHESWSIRVSCAVATAEERAQIEALIGALVAVKTPEGALVTGCVDSLSANDDGGFYTEYSFTLTQADMEEAVDIDA